MGILLMLILLLWIRSKLLVDWGVYTSMLFLRWDHLETRLKRTGLQLTSESLDAIPLLVFGLF